MDKVIIIKEAFTPIWHNHYGENGHGFGKDSLEEAMAVIKSRNENLVLPDTFQAIRRESVELITVNLNED